MYFLQAYNDKKEWWRYLITLVIVTFAYLIIGSIPLTLVFIFQAARHGELDLEGFSNTYDTSMLGIDQNLGLVLLLIPAVLGFIALLLSMIFVHGMRIGAIASAAGTIRWKRMIAGALIWLIMLAVVELFFMFTRPGNYTFTFDPTHFYPLVLIAVFLIPLQAGSEELFFRSYLLQGLGLLTRSRILSVLITSLAFGLLHSANPEVREFGFWSTMPYYIGFGIFSGLLVAFDNGIELACGVHAVNNFYTAVFVSYNGSALKTAALWKINDLDPLSMTIAFFIIAVLFLLLMNRLYKWKDKLRLFTPLPAR